MEQSFTYLGIDVSKSTLQVAQQLPDGSWQQQCLSNEINAISEWLSRLDLNRFWFIFEYTGTYSQRLCFCLQLLEAKFTILTPNQSKGFGQTLKKISKTDRSGGPQTRCHYPVIIWDKNDTLPNDSRR